MALPPTLDDENLYKFRTKICERYVKQGRCEFADKCQYSHDLRWTRRPPWKYNYHPELCHDLQFVKDGRGRTIAKSNCKQKRNCKFAHTKEEQVYHPKMYKTVMCKQFQTSAWCDRYYCPFAHSATELRPSDPSFPPSKIYSSDDQDSLCPDIYLPSDKPHPRLRARFLAIMESVGPGHAQLASNPTSISESGINQLRSRQPYTDFISSHTPQSVRSEPLSPTTVRHSKLAENPVDGAEPPELHDKCNSSCSTSGSSNAGRVLHVTGALESEYRPTSLRHMLQTAAKHIQDKVEMKRTSHDKPVELLQSKYTTVGVDHSHPAHVRSQGNSMQQHQQHTRQQEQHQQQPSYQQQQMCLKGLTPPTRAGRSQAVQLRSINGGSILGYPPAKTQTPFVSGSQQPQNKSHPQSTSHPVQLARGIAHQAYQTSDSRAKTSHVPSTAGFKAGGVQSRSQGTNLVPLRHSNEAAPAVTGTVLPGSATTVTVGESAPAAVAVAAGEKFLRQAVGNTDIKRASALSSFEPKVSGRLQDTRSTPIASGRTYSAQDYTSLDYLTGAAAAAGVVAAEMLQPCSVFSMRGSTTELHGGNPLERVTCAADDQQTKNSEVSSRRGSAEKKNFVPHSESEFNFQLNFQQMYGGGEATVLPRTLPSLQNVEECAGNLTNSTLSSLLPRIQQGFASGTLNVLADDVYYWSEPIGHCKDDASIQVFAGIMLVPEKQREVVAVKRIPVAATSKVRDTFALLERFTQLEDPLIVNIKRVYCVRTNNSSCTKEDEDGLSLMLVLEKCEGRLSEMISLSDLGERCLQEPLPPPGMTEMLSHLISGVLKIQQHSRAAHMRMHPGNVLLTEDFELKIGDCTGKIRYLSILELLETGLQGAQQARDMIHWILNSPTEASWLSPELLRSFMYMAQQITLLTDQQKMFPPHVRDGIPFAVLAQNLKWDTPFLQKADAWSTGATLFYIVSGGRHPYGDPEDRSTIKNVLEDRKVNLDKIRGSPLIYDLVESLLESDPDKRLNLCQALCHPAFWKMGETEHFLKEFKATVEGHPDSSVDLVMAPLQSVSAASISSEGVYEMAQKRLLSHLNAYSMRQAHPDSYLVLALSDPVAWISSLACGASPLFSLLVSYLASPACPPLLLTSLRVENGLSFLLFLSLLSSDARLPGKDRRALVSSAILLHPAVFLKAVRLLLFPRVPRDPAELVISRSSTYVKHYLGHFSCSSLLHATAQPASNSVSKYFGRASLRSAAVINTNGTSSTSSSGSKTGGSNNSGNSGSPEVASSPPPLQLLDTCKGGASRSLLFDQCRAICPSYPGSQLQRQSQPLPPPPPPVPSRCDTAYSVRIPPAATAVGGSSNQAGAPHFATPHAVFTGSPGVPGTAATASPVVPGSLGLPSVARPPPPPPPAFLAAEAGINSQQPGNLAFPFNDRILLANAGADASLLLPSNTRAQFYTDGNTMHGPPSHPHPGFIGTETDALCSASTRMVYPPTGPLGLDKRVNQPDDALLFMYHDKDNVCAPTASDACGAPARAPATVEDARTAAGDTCIVAIEGGEPEGERPFKQTLGNVEARVKHVGHSHGLSLSPLSSSISLSNVGPGTAVATAANPEMEGAHMQISPQRIAQQRYFPVETEISKPFSIYSFEDKYTDSCAYSPALHSSKEYVLHATAEPVGHTAEQKQYGSDAVKPDICHSDYTSMTSVEASICHNTHRKTTCTETAKNVGHSEYPEEYDADASKESGNSSVYRKGYTVDACKERGADGAAPRAGSTSASSQSTRLYTSSTPPIFASDKAEEQFQFLKYQEASSMLTRPQTKRETGTVSLAASNCTVSPSHDSSLSEGASTTHQSVFPSEAAQADSAETPLKAATESGTVFKEGESEHPEAKDKPKEKGDKADGRERAERKTEKERTEVVGHGGPKGRKVKNNASPRKVITGEKQKKDFTQKEGTNKAKPSC